MNEGAMWTVTRDPSGHFRRSLFLWGDIETTATTGTWPAGIEFTSAEGETVRIVENRLGYQYIDNPNAPRELQPADKLLHYIYSNNEIPDYKTMGRACKITVTQVTTNIAALVREGMLQRRGRGHRALWLTEAGEARYNELRVQ